jgi:hypothetical protein
MSAETGPDSLDESRNRVPEAHRQRRADEMAINGYHTNRTHAKDWLKSGESNSWLGELAPPCHQAKVGTLAVFPSRSRHGTVPLASDDMRPRRAAELQ